MNGFIGACPCNVSNITTVQWWLSRDFKVSSRTSVKIPFTPQVLSSTQRSGLIKIYETQGRAWRRRHQLLWLLQDRNRSDITSEIVASGLTTCTLKNSCRFQIRENQHSKPCPEYFSFRWFPWRSQSVHGLVVFSVDWLAMKLQRCIAYGHFLDNIDGRIDFLFTKFPDGGANVHSNKCYRAVTKMPEVPRPAFCFSVWLKSRCD